jgi:type VI protein secretion system component Hcp
MTHHPSDSKPASAPKSETKPSTELSPKELDEAASGMSDFHFTKRIDKSSPHL